jgi:hypothetical protein
MLYECTELWGIASSWFLGSIEIGLEKAQYKIENK